MLRKQLHIESINGSPVMWDFTVCGACYAEE